jgi:hypothetical protein
MDAETKQVVAQLQAQVRDLQSRVHALERMQVAPESGGGQVTISGGNAMLRLNSLTPASAQMP